MARRVRIDVLCDICQADDVEAEAEETEAVTLGRGKPLMLGLCKDHIEVWETFRDWLREYGQPADELPTEPSKNERGNPETCKICGAEYKYTGSLRAHVRDKHDMTLQEMRGDEPPPDNAPRITEAACDVKGCTSGPDGGSIVYTWPEYQRPAQALGLHKRQIHGIAGKTAKAS